MHVCEFPVDALVFVFGSFMSGQRVMNQHDGEVLKGNAASSLSTSAIAPYVCHPTLWSLEYKAGIRERDQMGRESERNRMVDGERRAKTKPTDTIQLCDIIMCLYLMLETQLLYLQ